MGNEEIEALLQSVPLGAELAAFLVAAVALATGAMRLYKARSGKTPPDAPK